MPHVTERAAARELIEELIEELRRLAKLLHDLALGALIVALGFRPYGHGGARRA